MSDNFTLSFADTLFSFDCEKPIMRTGRFSGFETDKKRTAANIINISVSFGKIDEPAAPAFSRGLCSFFGSENNFTSVTHYYDAKSNSLVPYAALTQTGRNGYTLTLDSGITPSDRILLDAIPYPEIMLTLGTPIIHASFVDAGGRALLFTGKSGAGKTTQGLIWEKRGARLINGDRAAIKIKNGKAFACGVPFCGSSDVALKAEMPLEAIIFPVHAEINSAVELKKSEGIRLTAVNFTYPEQSRFFSDALWSFTESLAESTRFVKLFCTPDERAATALEKIL